jgi:hypothetical protein
MPKVLTATKRNGKVLWKESLQILVMTCRPETEEHQVNLVAKSPKLSIEELEANGFVTRFRSKDGRLQCIDTGTLYEPEDLRILGIHRYEGTKDLGDQSVIYAISDGQGMRGVIIDSYGAYADADLGDCIRRIPVVKDKGHSAERPLVEEIE